MTGSPAEFELPAAMREEIIAHARTEAPRECCGVILSKDGELIELRRLTNFYEPESGELYRLVVETDESGTEIAAIYHSHPVSRAYPSARDVEHAGWPESVYLICSLEHPDTPVIRAFRIVDGAITELTLLSDN